MDQPKNVAEQWNEVVAVNAVVGEFRRMNLEHAAEGLRRGMKDAVPVAILAHVRKIHEVPEAGAMFGVETGIVTADFVAEHLMEQGVVLSALTQREIDQLVLDATRGIEEAAAKENDPYDLRLFISLLPTLPSLKRAGKPEQPGLLAVEQFRQMPVRMFEALCEKQGDLYVVQPWTEITRSDVALMEEEFKAAQRTSWSPARVAANKTMLN